MKLSSLRRPFVCLVVSEGVPERCIKVIDAYEKLVDAFEINLALLDEKSFGDVISSARRPCIVTNRRAGFMKFYGYPNLRAIGEDERAARLRAAVGLGASAVDCELDMFDESLQRTKPAYFSKEEKIYASRSGSKPVELSRDWRTVTRQKAFAREAKAAGAEMILSSHTQTVMRRSHARELISAMQTRGADFGKIVSLTPEKKDLVPFIESVMLLRDESKIPFNLMNVGAESILGRLISVELGSSWVYCRPDSGSTYGGQPTVSQAREFFAAMKTTRT